MDAIAINSQPNVRKIVPDGVLAIIFLLITEAMLFAGLISAYIVNRAGAAIWPPPDQPRLPMEVTGINTVILLLSAAALYVFTRRVKKIENDGLRMTNSEPNASLSALRSSLSPLLVTIILGSVFLAVQGTEWARLIGYGLTTHSSIYGAFFYTLVGAHGIHVLAGICILFYLYFAVKKAPSFDVAKNKISTCILYWYFVVAIWPILYRLVYFN